MLTLMPIFLATAVCTHALDRVLTSALRLYSIKVKQYWSFRQSDHRNFVYTDRQKSGTTKIGISIISNSGVGRKKYGLFVEYRDYCRLDIFQHT